MDFYNFIYCEKQVQRFVSQILFPLEEDEVVVLFLAARKKYAPQQAIKKEFLQRKIVTKRESFLRKLKQFNCQRGAYFDAEGNDIREEACVVYCTANPRSTVAAAKNLITTFTDYLFSLAVSSSERKKFTGIYQKTLSEIQKCRARKHYVDIDFDVVDKNKGKKYVRDFLQIIATSKHHIIETRGGYHILIEKQTMTADIGRVMYKQIEAINREGKQIFGEKFEVIINRQDMLPIPGTKQGGFAVCIIDKLE
ncbi:hypothetical protein UABAM_00768 [Candidatus Uabimicrobium amorphum]|uniref:Uncharacterized protein n=2 Tax=Uabimicrobium amorphum TaxID=2596890 RepID=A0A5S9IKT4_UABAM|nr:hypothetical protein [Candidatus Uabimicrobium amorphum]BBM82425.1 hypothetical protein UABAM_00768 [Candidatus Uabimicrobium amorphum]